MRDFDPNSQKKSNFAWASYVTHRHPEFKVHKRRSDAINAIGCKWPHCEGIAYELIDGKWQEILKREFPEICPLCNQPPRKSSHRYMLWVKIDQGYKIYQKYKIKSINEPIVCGECYDIFFGHYSSNSMRDFINWEQYK